MKKHFILASAVAVTLLASSCSATFPGIATTASSLKTGVASKKVWFGIAKNVDVSIQTAAKNGGIKKVATVDYGMKGGLFSKTYFTVVTGE